MIIVVVTKKRIIMKGKKSDQAFVAQFITESVMCGSATPDEILARAKTFITEIDNEIKAIEKKKITRSKLLDVVEAFEKKEQLDKIVETKILGLFELDYPEICQSICSHIDKSYANNKKTEINDLSMFYNDNITYSRVRFAIKQMIKLGILIKLDNLHFVSGPRYTEYMKYVLRNEA